MESDRPAPKAVSTPGPNKASEQLLKNAWERHDIYSDNATKAQQRFFFVRRVLAYLSIAVVILSVVQPVIRNRVEAVGLPPSGVDELSQAFAAVTNSAGAEQAAPPLPIKPQGAASAATNAPLATPVSGFATGQVVPEVPPDDTDANGDADGDKNRVGNLSIGALFRMSLANPLSWVTALTVVDFLLILLPILTTGLLAFAVKFDRGNNWVLLRGNSESLKTEIFYYRTRVKHYRHNRNAVLAEKIKMISERIKGSAVHQAALDPYEGQRPTRIKKGLVIVVADWVVQTIRKIAATVWDTLFQVKEAPLPDQASVETSDRVREDTPAEQKDYRKRYADLDADHYIRFRLEDQFDWYRRKAKIYDRDYQTLQSGVYIFGGLGTLLAAIGLQNWVAVSTTLAGAVAGYLEYKRVEATLVGYNQAADSLYDIRAWWYSLSDEEKNKSSNFEKLVASTEETIRSEHTSWLQDMQDRLANLYGDAGEEENNEGLYSKDTEEAAPEIAAPELPSQPAQGATDQPAAVTNPPADEADPPPNRQPDR